MDIVYRSRRSPFMKAIGMLCLFCGLLLAGFASPVRAQDGPETGGNEIGIWTAGGHGTNCSTRHPGIWTAGFRSGWVVGERPGPNFFPGGVVKPLHEGPVVV